MNRMITISMRISFNFKQIDILQSKIRSLERDLTIQRNERESISRKRK